MTVNAKQVDVEVEATRTLNRLGCDIRNPQDQMGVANVMWSACDALNKGNEGELALKGLIELWRQLNFQEVTAESIPTLLAVVNRLCEKIEADLEGSAMT
jgi:hypothetical protein